MIPVAASVSEWTVSRSAKARISLTNAKPLADARGYTG